MPTRRTKTLMIRSQFKTAYENHKTLREIAAFHGVSSGTVRNALIDLGVPLRSRGRKPKPQKSVWNDEVQLELPNTDQEPIQENV